MELTLKNKFKSLEPFTIDLPDFVVITGINGAGKTHLLTGINDKQILVTENKIQLTKIKYVTTSSLSPNDSTIITKQDLNNTIQTLWNKISNYQIRKKTQPKISLDLPIIDINAKDLRLISIITELAQKNIETIDSDEFYNWYPTQDLSHNDIFHQNFSSLFKRYNDKFLENQFKEFLHKTQGTDSNYLSKEEFIRIYGEEPWTFVNKILTEANLDYSISPPNSINSDAPFEVKLRNKINNIEIKFSDLSSGEKVLMSLALSLYNSNFDFEFPEILLMDEPDASLHPTMTKQFLDVIQKVFVEDKKVKVIISTHSPSTIALASEETIYVANKTGERIEKSTKDKALKILTAGVPSFSVNYENRRQVFVESPNDVLFYERIYQKLSSELIPEISLSFISSGDSRTDKNGIPVSNCDQVKTITDTLRNAGNNLVWGIVDWDEKAIDYDYVKVLGNGNRYSIESYILDPLLIGALLLREKLISKEDLGLTPNQSYTDFKTLSQPQLQFISDKITDLFLTEVKPKDQTKGKTTLLNGIEIEIPIWYLHHQGHELENILLKIYPQLDRIKKKREELLKLEILDKIVDDIPEILSKDLLDILQKVQEI